MSGKSHNWSIGPGWWQCIDCGAMWPPEDGKSVTAECMDWLRINADEQDRNYAADE